MIDALTSLNFIWEFLKPVGSDLLKDKLKRTPGEKAKRAVLELYCALTDCLAAVDKFIESFAKLPEMDDSKKTVEDTIAAGEQSCLAERNCEAVVDCLMRITDSMAQLDPQLGIHKPDLVKVLANFGMNEALLADHVDHDVLTNSYEPHALHRVLDEARANRDMLAKALEDFRSFIGSQFAFKDLF